jgi:hypothetical protein
LTRPSTITGLRRAPLEHLFDHAVVSGLAHPLGLEHDVVADLSFHSTASLGALVRKSCSTAFAVRMRLVELSKSLPFARQNFTAARILDLGRACLSTALAVRDPPRAKEEIEAWGRRPNRPVARPLLGIRGGCAAWTDALHALKLDLSRRAEHVDRSRGLLHLEPESGPGPELSYRLMLRVSGGIEHFADGLMNREA